MWKQGLSEKPGIDTDQEGKNQKEMTRNNTDKNYKGNESKTYKIEETESNKKNTLDS